MDNLKVYQSRRYVDATFLDMAMKVRFLRFKNLTVFAILKGGMYTAYNVWREGPLSLDDKDMFGYIGLSSYKEETTASDKLEITYDSDLNDTLIEGRNVLIIDDVSDSGRTLDYAKGLIRCYHPTTVKTAVLVDKRKNREKSNYPKPDIAGYTYEGSNFLVGCGMGRGEEYRHLRELYEIVPGE